MKTQDLIHKLAVTYTRLKDQYQQIPINELNLFRADTEFSFQRIFMYAGPKVLFVDYDPYISLTDMYADFKAGYLKVSKLNNNSQLLPGDLNLKFRAVHDYFHCLFQQEFGFQGELITYKGQKYLYTSQIGKQILYSEIVMQAAYFEYFGYFPSEQKVIYDYQGFANALR